MSNLPKNLLLALTLACLIALVAFFIQLIIINTGVDEPPTTVSSGQPNNDSANDGSDSDSDLIRTPPPHALPPERIGTRHELLVTGNTGLIIYADEERFDFTENDSNWTFEFTGLGTASLEIALMIISEQGLAADAVSFLRSHTGISDVDPGGDVQILNSPLRGYYVTAHSDYAIYEAWFHNLQSDGLALVFVVNYGIELQRDAIYRVLNSMSFAQVQVIYDDTSENGEE